MGRITWQRATANCGLLCSSVFFFQAEDGIRDYKVTGVQTCALPISAAGGTVPRRRERLAKRPSDEEVVLAIPGNDHRGLLAERLRGKRRHGEPTDRRNSDLRGEAARAKPVVATRSLHRRLHRTGMGQGRPRLSRYPVCGELGLGLFYGSWARSIQRKRRN